MRWRRIVRASMIMPTMAEGFAALAFVLVPIGAVWLWPPLAMGIAPALEDGPVRVRMALGIYLVAGPLAIVATRAWRLRMERWPFRLASALGWGMFAIIGGTYMSAWLVVPRLGIPPQNTLMVVAVPICLVVLSQVLVFVGLYAGATEA